MDLRGILEGPEPSKAVPVVQHDHVPRQAMKMDGQPQNAYPRKNWSSLMLFNSAHPVTRALTSDVVDRLTPAQLHRFEWAGGDAAIGALAPSWNFLVGEYAPPPHPPFGIHFTNGGPWFPGMEAVDYASLWGSEGRLGAAAQS